MFFLLVAAVYIYVLDVEVRERFDGSRWKIPARMYARPLELYAGKVLSAREFESELKAANYHREKRASTLQRAGTYRRVSTDTFHVFTRNFVFWDGEEVSRHLVVKIDSGKIEALSQMVGNETGEIAERAMSIARIDPALIGQIYPHKNEDRILVRLEQIPDYLLDSIIALEDRDFYHHSGVSLKAIARALWTNLKAGGVVQGGSTITQQLAKSYFLSDERTLWRKINDFVIALLLELHYSKDDLLESYVNEIYLGQSGSKGIHGFGLAAMHYFGRRVDELSLAEAALLVTIIRGPSYYNPRKHPQRVIKRRALVLDIMADQNMIARDQAEAAKRKPLGLLSVPPPVGSLYPEFMVLVRSQLMRDYHADDLRSEGLKIFTTLNPSVQDAAKVALNSRLERFDRETDERLHALEGAVVVVQPQTGEVLALLGGRDNQASGFNRALNAKRPIGSLVKPLIYSAALERAKKFSLVTQIEDKNLVIARPDGDVWKPKNYAEKTHGKVALITALAKSYNLATIKLGMDVGVDYVTETLSRFGIERDVKDYPSTMLGAVDLAPIDVAKLYTPFATGGYETPLRVIRNVSSTDGELKTIYALSARKVLNAETSFLARWGLQEVILSGTAYKALNVLPTRGGFAGKTGTTNGYRDSWFVGFGEDLLSVVWIGHDDYSSTGLTGSTGALPVWMDLVKNISNKPFKIRSPENINWALADPLTGDQTAKECETGRLIPFVRGYEPAKGSCSTDWFFFRDEVGEETEYYDVNLQRTSNNSSQFP